MRTAIRQVLLSGSLDPDALAYIRRVQLADGAVLEREVARAYNSFIVGAKNSGIWSAIRACCILAGARTLNGALQPLVGSAPTNFNFISSDYDRKTGLKGDGSTKYLNSNRSGALDISTDHHLSVFYQRTTNSSGVLIGTRPPGNDTGGKHISENVVSNTTNFTSTPNIDNGFNTTPLRPVDVPGFVGLSRSATTFYSARISSNTLTFSRQSSPASSSNIFIFVLSNGETPIVYSDSRISFYSIGGDINLSVLESLVTSLMTELSRVI